MPDNSLTMALAVALAAVAVALAFMHAVRIGATLGFLAGIQTEMERAACDGRPSGDRGEATD